MLLLSHVVRNCLDMKNSSESNLGLDNQGKFRNEFGIMEKCVSCQKKEMTFESVVKEPEED